ncbi:hypothetical protein KL86DES1_21106 [uncultured Desulfovibrio sp.]|uniref:Uncharacterized protein n=1 Tax=uncultured Desulfovibrio sp. TaxID=167968 RepID=A0A212L6N3_9BACT|nr:hypothetical protein KL86DES1_21106 [uncultured Desulfovibrio sp.]
MSIETDVYWQWQLVGQGIQSL